MTQTNTVLIVSDRPQLAALLARAVENVVACRCIEPGASLPAALPAVAVVDVSRNATLARAWVARLHASRIATLQLTNQAAAIGRTVSATRTLRADAPRTVVLATLFNLIDSRRTGERPVPGEPSVPSAATAARAESLARVADAMVTRVFEAAGAGRALTPAETDAGTEVILEAVSECGIRTWLEAIERHDQQLYQHSLSVAGYAAAFGTGLGLPRADRMRLARAALLHDLGKARIPLEILNKPGRLTPAEMAVMQTHPAIGADLLRDQEGFDAQTLQVVRHHHEMLDGSGYPDGLAGAAIPDLVRLVTICDIHSALTERRPYRDPLPHREAHALMLDMVPRLDADLLRAFERLVLQAIPDAAVA
ncbi:HD domain-containing protein [Methylobacterium sp. J-078]|uniref:HD-GYP domain-containing protein n=1 Tax=Methylobacterium sp. J-078 TaxID=2836657 RepID=UPI001FB9A81C|nr:HD domain-containing phosphohydrolase [Methylobacterium sp. J-078]MCJ2043633.1 HD domain-containing protein [Methylobacterium sp. J-078]